MSEREHVDFSRYQEDIRDLTQATESFKQAIGCFDADKHEVSFFDEWSLKDMLAHFSAWAILTVESFESAKTGGSIPMLLAEEDWDEFNRVEVSERHSMSWEEVLAEFISTENELLNCYKTLSEEEPNDTLLEFITYCIGWDVEHYLGHLASFNMYKDI